MHNVTSAQAVTGAVEIEATGDRMTVAEYLEQYDPVTAEGIHDGELPEWLAELGRRAGDLEQAMCLSPVQMDGGTRAYHTLALGWAVDLAWGPAGGRGMIPERCTPQWFTTHAAAPILRLTAEERAASGHTLPPYEWKISCEYLV